MFNHSDTLETSSWHGTVLGTKWWYVCKGECFESYVEPGEVLYYGAGWSHETQNLVTPTLTVTGTVVHEWNYRTVANRLHSECSASALNFLFSAELCDALDKCYDHWHEHVRLRSLATFSLLAQPPTAALSSWLCDFLLAFAGGRSVVSVSAVCESAEARRAVEPVEDHRYIPTTATQIPCAVRWEDSSSALLVFSQHRRRLSRTRRLSGRSTTTTMAGITSPSEQASK